MLEARVKCSVLATAALILCCGVAAAQPLLRYSLPQGQCRIYEREVEARRDGRVVFTSKQSIRIWFLDTHIDQSQVWIEIAPLGEAPPILYAVPMRLDRVGNRHAPPEVADRLPDVESALEILPGQVAALQASDAWRGPADSLGRFLEQRTLEPAAATGPVRVTYEMVDSQGVDPFLGRSARGEYTWDAAAGCVARVEEHDSIKPQSLEVVIRGRCVGQEPVADSWRERRLREIGRYLGALRTEASWFARAQRGEVDSDGLLTNVDRVWGEFLHVEPRDDDSPVRRAAESRRRELRAQAQTLRDRVQLARRWVGTHAAPWSLQTPAGATIRSESLGKRGLVEVFWSAGSPNCLRAMAVIRAAAAAAAGCEVGLVCINLDTDVNAARAAIEACGGGIPQVLSGPPIGGESPADLPIVRLLDADRKVIRVLFGRHADLAGVIDDVYARRP